MQVWVKQKAQETWQFLSSSPPPPPFIYFTGPLCLSVCWRSTLHPSTLSLCVAVAYCTMLLCPTSHGLCLHLGLHKMDNEKDVYCISSPHRLYFGLSSPLSLHTWNQWTWNIVLGAWSATKNHPHPPLNMAPDLEDKKLTERRNCLIRASGRTSVTPMHTPGFCQAERHDNHFLLLLLESHAC